MDLEYEKELIKSDAEFALNGCKERAEDRELEIDYVISEFLKAFNKLVKDNTLN